MSELTDIVGNRIRFYRKSANLTQSDLADLTGLNRSYISMIEKGTNCSVSTIAIIAEALGIELNLLFEDHRKICPCCKQHLKE